jgi:hypothetical protein
MEVRYRFCCKCVELMLAKADTFVDLGPGTVTMIFGRDEEKVEEQCHNFPLAAHSQVFRKMLTVDMLEKASGRVEMPHISPATGRLCSGSVAPILVPLMNFRQRVVKVYFPSPLDVT